MAWACAGLAVAASGLAGCGVGGLGPETLPQPLPAKSVPFGLLGPLPQAGRLGRWLATARAIVYLEGNDQRLVAVQAKVASPATIAAALAALAAGPTASQSDRGLVSPASSVGPFRTGAQHRGTATVDLPVSFENLSGEDQIVAAAQIVFTVTAFPRVKGVIFLLGGQDAQVPNQQGKLVAGPVTRSDYSALGG